MDTHEMHSTEFKQRALDNLNRAVGLEWSRPLGEADDLYRTYDLSQTNVVQNSTGSTQPHCQHVGNDSRDQINPDSSIKPNTTPIIMLLTLIIQ